MLYEYAVEPACLKDWQTFRYLIEQFGVSRGRLLSEFPKNWIERVHEACSSFSFRQRQQLLDELTRLRKGGFVRSGRKYDGARDWVSNALNQISEGWPLHALIVAEESDPREHVMVASEISHADPRWAVKREIRVPRTAEALGGAVQGLLQIGKKVLFVDKMFEPASERWQTMLAKFVALAIEGRDRLPELEYHTKIDNEEFGKPAPRRTEDFKGDCYRFLAPLLPIGVSLKVVRWDQHHGGDFFHERCILTDKGGIRIDWGLDVGKLGETTLVSLLEDDVWEESWNSFQVGATKFRFIDEVTVQGAME